MNPRPALVFALAALAACTNLEALHRSEPEVPTDVLIAAAQSDRPADSGALVLLAEMAAHHPDRAPSQETLATVFEALGTRARAGTLPPVHADVAGTLATSIALDDTMDAAVRMNACDLLAALGRDDALAAVAADALDPLVVEHAEDALTRSAGEPRPE